MTYTEEFLTAAHKGASYHKAEIVSSEVCGCFYCLRTFAPEEIDKPGDPNRDKWPRWIDNGTTAVCPRCGIDSVLPDTYPVHDPEFLEAMEKRWFDIKSLKKKKSAPDFG